MKNNLKLSSIAAISLITSPMGFLMAADAAPSSTCVALTSDQIQAVLAKLDTAHQQIFKAMNCEGQTLAMELVNQSCKGQNTCKGLNSCKTEQNSCKGEGSCKGTSKGPFENKNEALEIAAKHMIQKRMESMGQNVK